MSSSRTSFQGWGWVRDARTERTQHQRHLAEWDRSGDLDGIDVPTLVIGAQYDTMDSDHLRAMAERLPKGRYLHCPQGSHFALYDDQATYFAGLIDFLGHLAE